MAASALEQMMEWQIRAAALPVPVREYRFDPSRRWRFDFAWPEHRVALEVEGGIHVNGRHNRASGFESDCEKYCSAVVQGWAVLRVTGKQVRAGVALGFVERALAVKSPDYPGLSNQASLL